jgi:transposase-like protein
VRQAREQGPSLTGPDGLLRQLTKTVLETALDQELTEHLGHEKNGTVVNETGNVRSRSAVRRASACVSQANHDLAGRVQPN